VRGRAAWAEQEDFVGTWWRLEMHLILGSREDVLVSEISRKLKEKGSSPWLVSEADLFSATPFAFQRNGVETGGFLRIQGNDVSLASLSSVLVRLPLTWWPGGDLDLQDQTFVYHETRAAYFALLSSLRCTVVNRFSLEWWVHDLTYPEALTLELAQRLNCEAALAKPDPMQGRLYPTGPDPSSSTVAVYLAGGRFIPQSHVSRSVENIARMSPAIAEWQSQSGIQLCRLDFDIAGVTPRLRYAETFPVMNEEAPEVVGEIATATLEVLL
jgi:hypothetical protein